MRGWRGKLVFMLIMYFAGFATAIYCLAPSEEKQEAGISQETAYRGSSQSEQFAMAFNDKLHDCLELGKQAAVKTSDYVRTNMIQESTVN